jgi:hypothetical protein
MSSPDRLSEKFAAPRLQYKRDPADDSFRPETPRYDDAAGEHRDAVL